MKPGLLLVSRLRRAFAAFSELLARRWKNSFYLYLAALFTLFAVADAAFLHVTAEMRQAAFDAMVRYRIIVPKPDPDIVILDINEASLAAMAKDYGRWPWPRQVMGEFLEQIEKQQPKAVVFDILFSDADVYNPDSDAYFDAAIDATHNTFFPMLRLDPASDALSQVKPSMIPGVAPLPGEAKQDATIAVVLPHFQAALNGGRLGLHNIYPDVDGTVRQYLVYRNEYGWKLPSLPARVARELGWPEPAAQRVLLNWRGPPFSYRYLSFSDVYTDLSNKQKKRPQDEFRNKIVIIGSTAPSLFDIKPTPLSQMHPGVEILATALDNFKHGDYLRFPEARVAYLLLSLVIVWITAWGFYSGAGRSKIDRLFGASQFILVGISYASINFTNTYINLTGPVSIGLAYFTIARIYASATGKALERNMVRASSERGGELRATLLLIRLDTARNVVTDTMLEKIRYGLEKSGKEPKSAEVLKGYQKGLWDLFESTFAVSWVVAAEDADGAARVAQDVALVLAALPPLLRKNLAYADNAASWFVHHGLVSGGAAARASWRVLFAQALL
ncbi:MAG: CHASE2 domain-containing protein, partial [Betaproteobacteria bacterium]|nr:CHASE2 domain-containing protein [Betaproteobacteria bacterium]